MSLPIENHKDIALSKAELKITKRSQPQAKGVTADHEKPIQEGLNQLVSKAHQIREPHQETNTVPALNISFIGQPPTQRPVHSHSFADLDSTLRTKRNQASTAFKQHSSSYTDRTYFIDDTRSIDSNGDISTSSLTNICSVINDTVNNSSSIQEHSVLYDLDNSNITETLSEISKSLPASALSISRCTETTSHTSEFAQFGLKLHATNKNELSKQALDSLAKVELQLAEHNLKELDIKAKLASNTTPYTKIEYQNCTRTASEPLAQIELESISQAQNLHLIQNFTNSPSYIKEELVISHPALVSVSQMALQDVSQVGTQNVAQSAIKSITLPPIQSVTQTIFESSYDRDLGALVQRKMIPSIKREVNLKIIAQSCPVPAQSEKETPSQVEQHTVSVPKQLNRDIALANLNSPSIAQFNSFTPQYSSTTSNLSESNTENPIASPEYSHRAQSEAHLFKIYKDEAQYTQPGSPIANGDSFQAITTPGHSSHDVILIDDSPEPPEQAVKVSKPLTKKDPRGRNPKALTNPATTSSGSSSKLTVKVPPRKRLAKIIDGNSASSSTPAPIKKSRRQAAMKAAAEEAEKQAFAESIRLVEATVTAEITQPVEADQKAGGAYQLEAVQELVSARFAKSSYYAGYTQEDECKQPNRSSQQAASSYVIESSPQTSTKDHDANFQELIELTDTEADPTPKNSAIKRPVKKTKKASTKGHTTERNKPTNFALRTNAVFTSSVKKSCTVKAKHKDDLFDEYVPDKNIQPAPKLATGRKRRAATTLVHYNDFEADYFEGEDFEVNDFEAGYFEDEVPRSKISRKAFNKGRKPVTMSTKPAKEKIKLASVRPKRSSATAKVSESYTSTEPIFINTDDEVEETEIAQNKAESSKNVLEGKEGEIKKLLQRHESTLAQVDFRQLIPRWLNALSEADKQELALLLPKPDQVVKNKQISIRTDFGRVSTTHFYEAAEKWQDILFMGGFEAGKKVVSQATEEDTFKDDNYEQHWGDRIVKFNSEKRKREQSEHGLLNLKKAKGKGKATTARHGRQTK